MRSDAVAQTGATLVLGMLMTAALIVLQQTGLPSVTAPVPSARASDSYNVLRVPLNLADLLPGEGDKGETVHGEVPTTDQITMRPAAGPTVSKLRSRPLDDVPEARPATSRPQPNRRSAGRDGGDTPGGAQDRSHRRKPTQPTRNDERGRPDMKHRGRDRAAGSGPVNGGKVGAPTRTAHKPHPDRIVPQRDGKVRAAAVQRRRTSVGRGLNPARQKHGAQRRG